jgi:hypothetical protein
MRALSARPAALAALALLAACAAFGVHRASDDLASLASGPEPAMRLFATGASAGFLGPCGCERSQYGGFARRAAYVRAFRRPGDLTLDLGNLLSPEGPSPVLTFDAALEALRTLGCDALVPAAGEIRRGEEFEACAKRQPALPVVCANLRRAGDGERPFAPWLLHRTKDGRTVAVIGVAEPFDEAPPRYRVDPPADAVRAAMTELAGRADAFVVAGGLGDDAATALADALPGVTLVVGGNSPEGARRVRTTAGAPVLHVGTFGWHVGRVEFDEAFRVTGSWLAWLDPGVPDDAEVAAIVARWQASVSDENAGFAEKLVAQFRQQKFAGSEACATCHEAEFATWKASRHAHAMATLATKGSERDPACIRCHLADVPLDPKAAPAPLQMGLGCEGCHGGAARHAELAREGSKGSALALSPAKREGCLRCHSPPNDTHFDFGHHWPKIAHGPKSAHGPESAHAAKSE